MGTFLIDDDNNYDDDDADVLLLFISDFSFFFQELKKNEGENWRREKGCIDLKKATKKGKNEYKFNLIFG